MAEITVTDKNFMEAVVQSPLPVLLDFWATWCGPCKMISPIVADIAEEMDGKLTVGKVNVDEENELAAMFGIQSIPTLVLMKDGEVVKSTVGYQTKEKLLAFINE